MHCPHCRAPIREGMISCENCHAPIHITGPQPANVQRHPHSTGPNPPALRTPLDRPGRVSDSLNAAHSRASYRSTIQGQGDVANASPTSRAASDHASLHELDPDELMPLNEADYLSSTPLAEEATAIKASPYQEVAPQGEMSTQGAIKTQIVAMDQQADRHTRIVDLSVPAHVKKAVRDRDRGDLDEDDLTLFDELVISIKQNYRRLHLLDRYTTLTILGLFIASFLPWRRVPLYGLISGIEDLGAISLLAALVSLGLIYWRTVKRRVIGFVLPLQFISISLGAFGPIYRFITDPKSLYFGAYLTVGLVAFALVLSFIRLIRIQT